MNSIRSFLIATLANHENVSIIYPESVETRLSGTCFRGKRINRAGNFCLWNSFHEMRANEFVRLQMEAGILEAIEECLVSDTKDRVIQESLEIECDGDIGWSSTESVTSFREEQLESFNLNQWVTALRVRTESGVLASRTNTLTIVYTLYHDVEECYWRAVIQSLYPGRDVGPLREENGFSDLTEREGLVFFDWNHPGQAA